MDQRTDASPESEYGGTYVRSFSQLVEGLKSFFRKARGNTGENLENKEPREKKVLVRKLKIPLSESLLLFQ